MFDVNPAHYADKANTDPPTITQFSTDEGQQRSQVLSADTQTVIVRETVSSRDGEPLVAGDAYLSHPDDSVERLSADVNGDTFTAVFPIASGPGKYQVEIVDTTGAAVVNTPVFVGVPYVASPPAISDLTMAPAESEQQALERRASVRTGHGLSALNVDPRLTGVADAHLADMVASNRVCHCWTDGSNLLDHLTAAGIPVHWVPVPGQVGWHRLQLVKASVRRNRHRSDRRTVFMCRSSSRPARRLHQRRRRRRQGGRWSNLRHRVRW